MAVKKIPQSKSSKVKKSDAQIQQDKTTKLMNIIAWRCAYYRANPDKFFKDFAPKFPLKVFQKIILYLMAHNDNGVVIGQRG